MVETEPCGRFTYYKLRPDALDDLAASFDDLAASFDDLAASFGDLAATARTTGRDRPQAGLLMTTPATTPVTPAPPQDASVVARLSTLDRFLAVWIRLAMALGLGLGRLIPGLNDALASLRSRWTSSASRCRCSCTSR